MGIILIGFFLSLIFLVFSFLLSKVFSLLSNPISFSFLPLLSCLLLLFCDIHLVDQSKLVPWTGAKLKGDCFLTKNGEKGGWRGMQRKNKEG
jgi:hypothetical protein